jgi:hypothetical protein
MPDPQIEAARVRLLQRAQRMAFRARRARIGSNERRKALGQAQLLSACVTELDSDKKLRQHLDDTGVLAGGWRSLADAVVVFVRQRDKKKASHA